MEIAPDICAVQLVEPFFQGFTVKPVADACLTTEVLTALQCGSRAEVDDLVARVVATGGTTPNPPVDHGVICRHGFVDLGGHPWGVFGMDESSAPAQS